MANEIINSKPKFSVAIQSDTYKKLINNTLGDPKKAQRFIASISSAVATNPSLQECESGSILSGALLGEALNLSPSPTLGRFYLVPYNCKDANGNVIKKAQFQIGFKGLLELCMRSGQYEDIDAFEIHEGEFIGRDKTTGKFKFEFIENEAERLSKPIIGYMAYFELNNGFKKTIYMSMEEMEQHANTYSKAFDLDAYRKLQAGQIPQKDMWKYSSYWYKNFNEMAIKTVLRRLLNKYGIMSIEMQDAIEKDMSVIKEDGSYDYVDNPNFEEVQIVEPIVEENVKTLDEIE